MNEHPHDMIPRLKQERDDARRWAEAWKALARAYGDYQRESLPSVLESLRKRDELAAQVGALREALERVRDILAPMQSGHFAEIARGLAECGFDIAEKVLALTPPAALKELEARVRGEERELVDALKTILGRIVSTADTFSDGEDAINLLAEIAQEGLVLIPPAELETCEQEEDALASYQDQMDAYPFEGEAAV